MSAGRSPARRSDASSVDSGAGRQGHAAARRGGRGAPRAAAEAPPRASEQEFERVGGRSPSASTCASSPGRPAPTSPGRSKPALRADLYYRLAVFSIDVPPLRRRPKNGDDVLAQALLTSAGRSASLNLLTGLTRGALDRLLAHDWPGNVRELGNVIERAAIVATGSAATEDDLPPLARFDAKSPRASPRSDAVVGRGSAGRRAARERRTRAHSPRPRTHRLDHRGEARRRDDPGHRPQHAALADDSARDSTREALKRARRALPGDAARDPWQVSHLAREGDG